MAITLNIAVGQVVTDDFIKSDETLTIELRTVADTATTYRSGSHIGDGIYQFTTVASDEYKIFTSTGTELTRFGVIKVGEGGAVLTTGNQTVGGAKTFSAVATFSSQSVFTNGFQTNTIAERSAATGVTIDGILLKDDLTTSNIVNLNGTQTISAVKTFSALPESSVVPTTANQLTNKTYVDNQVANINVTPYQQGSNIRRVIYGGTVQSGKVYSSIEDALENIATTSATSRYIIELEKGQADSNYGNVFQVSHSAISSLSPCYVTIKGKSRPDTHLLLGETGDTGTLTSANLIFEDMSIYLSNNDLTGARIYNSVTFINCDIYAYENLTLPSCKLTNCRVWSSNGKTVTISGSGYYLGCYFTASVTESGSGFYTSYTDSLDSTPTMPTEPDLST